jgi:phosphoenolpyruvate phosphomutase
MSASPADALRRLIAERKIVVIPGAYDVLSARLISHLGFEAIWAGGFVGSATLLGMPDASLLTMTEQLEYARRIVSSSGLPTVVDCDNGYGNAVNVVRAVREFEAAGVAAIQIEDQELPKRCALYPGQRAIVSQAEMIGKIRAAVDSRHNAQTMIWARTDALGAGLTVDHALERAAAYVDAGADAIVPISKKVDLLLQFAGRWHGPAPLVIAPTRFEKLTSAEIARAGYKVQVVALVAAFAALRAMTEALIHIRKDGSWAGIRDRLATFEEFTDLVDLAGIAELERRYVPEGTDLVDREAVEVVQ